MSVAGIGIDAVDVARFEKAAIKYGKNFLKKMFTNKELEYAETKKDYYTHMAGKFAAKEAVKKAMPNGAEIGLNWPSIEILNSSDGKPYVVLHNVAKLVAEKENIGNFFVSISHIKSVATANAMAVKNGK